MSDVNLSTLPLTTVSDDEQDAINRLLAKLRLHQRINRRQDLYYGARQAVRDLGIAIPPHLRDLEAAIGWPAMAVDVLNERIRQEGWMVPGVQGDDGLGEIEEQNQLRRELRVASQLAMRHGVAFGVAGEGADGEPAVLVTVEPATRMTATWDHRRKGITEAILADANGGRWVKSVTLWFGDQIIELSRESGRWVVDARSTSVCGRPPIARFVNRYGSDRLGRSEITRPLRAFSDNAIRTIVSMEVSRDFHAAPKFWLLGADESQFVGADGERKSAWETYLGRMNAIPASENSDKLPTIQQFAGASPEPFILQLRALAQMVSAESALPISYLGLVHDANPASADAALVSEARLNLRAEDRQDDFGADRGLLAKFAMWIRDGEEPATTPRPIWRNPATPTLSAAADATTKLIAAGVLPPDSEITLRRIGLDENDIATLRNEKRRADGTTALRALLAPASNGPPVVND